MMIKQDLEPIVETYYKGLDEGKIYGRRCTRCGHIEFPPYLCCNTCGCLDTEWIDLSDMTGVVGQVLPSTGAFGDPEFRKAHGDYWAVEVKIPGADPVNSSLHHIDPDKLDAFTGLIYEKEVRVKPLLIQDEDVKVVVWELAEDEEFRKLPQTSTDTAAYSAVEETAAEETIETAASIDAENDPVAQTVLACAADAYGVDAADLTMQTDIRLDLSNESMKMIVMISEIEDELDVTIEIQEAGFLNTLADFVYKIKEKMDA